MMTYEKQIHSLVLGIFTFACFQNNATFIEDIKYRLIVMKNRLMCFIPEIIVVILMMVMAFFNMKNGTSWLSQSSYLIWIAYMSLLAYVCCKFLKEDIDNRQKIFYIKVLMSGTIILNVISIVLGCYCFLIDDAMGLKSSIGVAILTFILAIVNIKRLKRYINEDHYDD